jgi:hypothetical protein
MKHELQVSFDEVSQFATLKGCDVYTEDEYWSLCSLSLEELSKMACMKCSLCRKADCGRCKGCRANAAAGPRAEKKVCLFKVRPNTNLHASYLSFPLILTTPMVLPFRRCV